MSQPANPHEPLPRRHKRVVGGDPTGPGAPRQPSRGSVPAPGPADGTQPTNETAPSSLPCRWRRQPPSPDARDGASIFHSVHRLYVYPLLRGRYVKALALGLAALLCVFIYYGITWTWSSGDAVADSENSAADTLPQKVLPSIVTIQKDSGRGTGFVIENGLVVTAYHVVPKGREATVVFQDGERAKVVEHIAWDRERDVAVLRIDTKRKLEPLELAGALPAVGEPVASFQPGGGELRGEVLDSGDDEVLARIAGRVILRTTLKTVPGWSGSPIVNMEGRVVGVVSISDGGHFKAAGIQFIGTGSGAVPVTVLRALLGIPQLDEAIRLHPGSAERYHDRASLHCYNGDLDKAIADYAEAIRLKPEYAEAYCNRGQAYARKGDFDKAVADYTKAIDLGRKTFEEYQARAAAYDKKGDRSKAIRDYTEAIRLKPQTPALYRLRGFVYAASGAHEQAIADLTEAIRLKPKSAELYCARGAIYGALRQFDKAINDFTEAICLDRSFVKAYENRGAAYREMGEQDRALTDLTQVIRLRPNVGAYMARGRIYALMADNDKAIADYTAAIRLNRAEAILYEYRGRVYAKTGDFDKALADLTEAVRFDPKNADFHYARGEIYANQREFHKAVLDFTEAIRLDPRFAKAYYARARVNEQLGDSDKARTDLKRAMDLGYQPD